jgi:multiple antibiotic resistance protein
MLEKSIQDVLILWATIDPIGTLALFAAITAGVAPAERRKTAAKAIAYSAAILLSSIVIGQVILDGMGIKLNSLEVAGGAILFLFGLQMIFGDTGRAPGQPEPGHDIAVFPLAVPSIASPGAIMAVILLTDNDVYGIASQATTAAIMLGVLLITWVLMLLADPILRIIGKNGAAILVKVMGMILAALSAELILTALSIPGWARAAH